MNTHQNQVELIKYSCISGHIKTEWLEKLTNTNFLKRCQNGQISREELETFTQQHQIYSGSFTRFIAALLANIENDEHRQALTQNLFDEMGLGDAGTVPHSKLYRNMMDDMGLAPSTTPLPSTLSLVNTMFECCKSNNFMVALGAICLGAEAIVPYIYQHIVDGFLASGESLEKLQFFILHIECDDEHAKTMNQIINYNLQEFPTSLIDLNYGAEKMIEARISFFEGIDDYMQTTRNYAG